MLGTTPLCLLTSDRLLLQSEIPSNIPKRMRRILANRASAARSKERKKAIIELEEQVAELQQQHHSHEGAMHELRTSNATLGATGWWLGLCEVNFAAFKHWHLRFRGLSAAVLMMLCQLLRLLGAATDISRRVGRVFDEPYFVVWKCDACRTSCSDQTGVWVAMLRSMSP